MRCRLLHLTITLFVASANAFVGVQPRSRSTGVALAAKYDKQGHHITVDPMDGFKKSVDLNRARECAENFGKCSVEEIEQIKNSKSLLDDKGIYSTCQSEDIASNYWMSF